MLFCLSSHRLCLKWPLSPGTAAGCPLASCCPCFYEALDNPELSHTGSRGRNEVQSGFIFPGAHHGLSRAVPSAAPMAQLGLRELTPCHHPQGWCLCLFSFQNMVPRAKNLSFPLWHRTSAVFGSSAHRLAHCCWVMLHLHAHPIQYLGLSGGGGTGLSANKGDTEWLPSVPGGQISSAGNSWPGGTPWAVLVWCPRLVPTQAACGAQFSRGSPGGGGSASRSADRSQGLRKRMAKHKRKHIPCCGCFS